MPTTGEHNQPTLGVHDDYCRPVWHKNREWWIGPSRHVPPCSVLVNCPAPKRNKIDNSVSWPDQELCALVSLTDLFLLNQRVDVLIAWWSLDHRTAQQVSLRDVAPQNRTRWADGWVDRTRAWGRALLDTLQQTGGVIFDRHSSTTMSSACQPLAMSLNDFFTGHTK